MIGSIQLSADLIEPEEGDDDDNKDEDEEEFL
jgi:hypothetical protein